MELAGTAWTLVDFETDTGADPASGGKRRPHSTFQLIVRRGA